MRRIARRLVTAVRLSRADRRLLAEAAAALLAARQRGKQPFRALAAELGGLVAPGTPHAPSASLLPDQARAVSRVRWAIGIIAPWMPFRARCLQQAIAARTMLARRGIGSVLHLGVGEKAGSGSGSGLIAHAWLDAGGIKVTGYPVDPVLVEAGRFV
jgi:hypothetical protein